MVTKPCLHYAGFLIRNSTSLDGINKYLHTNLTGKVFNMCMFLI